MRKFLLTSRRYECDIVFTYSAKGVLLGFEVSRELAPEQLSDIVAKAFYHLHDLQRAYAAPKLRGLLTEMVQLLSFDDFWRKYAYPFDKKRAKAVWDKLPPHQQRRAYEYVETYNGEVARTGVARMYAKTYLHNKVWEV
jgi:hypothetical protein